MKLWYRNENRMPIPLSAVEDFKRGYVPGMIVPTYEMREAEKFGCHPVRVQVVKEIAEIYPHFFFTTDRKAVLYPDAMIDTGWWDRHKKEYYSKDGY